MDRRRFLASASTVGLVGFAGCTFHPGRESPREDSVQISPKPVIEGLHFPTAMEFTPNGRALICDRKGQLYLYDGDELVVDPVLDISDRMTELGAERGLLGIELHPEFATNRRFYLRYSAPLRDGMPEYYSHSAVLAEFRADDNLRRIPVESENVILEVPQPGELHQAGDLAFGPDGYLFIGMGDGAGYEVTESSDWYWWSEIGDASQITTNNLLGGILRIDVDGSGGGLEYSIPPDNPLVGEPGRDEYFAWGMRNPYRMSFDEGRLFVADVGGITREEVNIVEKGGNYGWPVEEGTTCAHGVPLSETISESPLNAFHPRVWLAVFNQLSPYRLCPETTNEGVPLRDPIVEYYRLGYRAIVGGYVYRGSAIPELRGSYLFADFGPPSPLYVASPPEDGNGQWSVAELEIPTTGHGRLSSSVTAFARDHRGEVYVLATRSREGSGAVYRLVR